MRATRFWVWMAGMTLILVVGGLAALLIGGELVVRAAVYLANRLRISPLIVGAVIIGLGTSLPEVVVCIDAVLGGSPGLAVGNVIGSNIANLLLVAGLSAVLSPLTTGGRDVGRNLVVLAIATVLFAAIGFSGQLTFWMAVVLLIVFLSYLLLSVWSSRDSGLDRRPVGGGSGDVATIGPVRLNAAGAIAIAILGLLGVGVGADMLVKGAIELAAHIGVPQEIIGLTVIAIGTSLPEIATSLVAAYRRQQELALGNILGSSAFNLTGLAGVTGLFAPLPFSSRLLGFDLWVLLGATGLFVVIVLTHRRISRVEGGVLAVGYCAYGAVQFLF